MPLSIKEVENKDDLYKFVKLPYILYKDDKNWVPYFIRDVIAYLDPEVNPEYKFCKVKLWYVTNNGELLGRIGGIINYKFNEKYGKKYGRVSRFECINDINIANLLFATVEEWFKKEGMEYSIGPYGFSNFDNNGLLIKGFEYIPSIASTYNFDYYQIFFEKNNYEKLIDWLEFRLKIEDIPEKVLNLCNLVKEKYKVRVLSFKKKKDLLNYGEKIFKLINVAFSNIFGFVELDQELFEFYKNKYLKFIRQEFVKVIVNEKDEVIAFIISNPSVSEALQKMNGKIFTTKIFHLVKTLKKPKVVDLLLTAVHPDYQEKGITSLLIFELQKTLREKRIEYAETTGILENNYKAINHWKNYSSIQHRIRRCYIKKI